MAISSTMPRSRTKQPWLADYKGRLGNFIAALGKHKVFMLAGSIAYTTALSLAPFVLILLSVAALLGQGFQNQIYTQMTELLGEQAGAAIRLVVENADNKPGVSTFSGIVGFLVLVISASAIFTQLRSSLDMINETPENKQSSGWFGFIKEKFFSMGLVFGFIFLAITSLAVTTVIAGVFDGQDALIWTAVAMLANIALFALLFTMMFHYIPTERLSWKGSFIAGITATVFFLVGKTLIGLYLGNAAVGSAYGAAGTIIVFLVWVYYTTITLLISYEFANNIFIVDRPKHEPL